MGYEDERLDPRSFPDHREAERGERYWSIGRAGREIILSNIGIYLVLVVKGIFRTFADSRATEYLRMFRQYPEVGGLANFAMDQGILGTIKFLFEETPTVFWANLIFAPMAISYAVLGTVGFVQSRFRPFLPMSIFAVVIANFIVLSATGIGTHRGRHPIMPLICVLGGYGLFWVYSVIQARWSNSPAHPPFVPQTMLQVRSEETS